MMQKLNKLMFAIVCAIVGAVVGYATTNIIYAGISSIIHRPSVFDTTLESQQIIEIYPLSAVVVSTDIMTDTVILDDGQNTWVLRGAEDWNVGDCVSMIMSTSGTTEIEDDVIVKARFSSLTVKGE